MPESEDARKKAILEQVSATPGANLRQVQRYTGIPLSTTARLLDELEAVGRVESESTAAYRRFFPIGKRLAKRDRVILGFVNKSRPRRIVEGVLKNPGIRHGELADHLSLPAPTLTYYMKQIVAADLIKVKKRGASRHYRVANAAVVKKALERTKGGYKPKFA